MQGLQAELSCSPEERGDKGNEGKRRKEREG